MKRTVVIDSLPESGLRYRNGYAVVAVDVIRATTMAITAVAAERACHPVDSSEAAFRLARRLPNALLAGELGGAMPLGFDMNNSPAALTERTDVDRPLILLSSSGTRLMTNAEGCDVLYAACFRNSSSTGRRLVREDHPRIAVLGAGSRGEFREEDQICCAWIAKQLVEAGYAPDDVETVEVLERWGYAKASDCLVSRSVDYLRKTGQLADLNFILDRIDDLDRTFILQRGEVIAVPPEVHLSRELDHAIA